jgi:hypothetical protein
MHPGFIDNNLKQPRAKPSPVFNLRQMKESLQRSFLDGLFRICRVPQHSQGRGEHHPGIRADEVMETCLLALADTRDDLFFLRHDRTHAGHTLQGTTFRFWLDLRGIVSTTIDHDAANKERLRGMGEINIAGRSVTFVSSHHLPVYEPTVADSGREPNLNQENSP